MRFTYIAVLIALGWLASPVQAQVAYDSLGGLISIPCTPKQTGTALISTTVTSGAITAGDTSFTVASTTGIAVGDWLTLGPGVSPVTVTSENVGNQSGGTLSSAFNGSTRVFGFNVAHASLLWNTLALTIGSNSFTDVNGRMGTFAGPFDGILQHASGWGGLAIQTAPASATPATAGYQYTPSELAQVSSVVGSTVTVSYPLKNAHSSGAVVRGGYFTLTKNGNRWAFCDPLGFTFVDLGVWGMAGEGTTALSGSPGITQTSVVTGKYSDINITYGPMAIIRMRGLGFNITAPFSINWFSGLRSDNRWPTPDQRDVRSGYCNVACNFNPSRNIYFGEFDAGFYGTDAPWLTDDALPRLELNNNYFLNYTGNNPFDFADPKFAPSVDFQLQNSGEQVEDPFAIGVMEDETDTLWCFSRGGDFSTLPAGPNNPNFNESNCGWFVLASPTHIAGGQGEDQGYDWAYTDTTNYLKTTMLTAIEAEYSTIAALNTAWGSTYTSFNSTGAETTGETVLTGDGTTTNFTHTLANLPLDAQGLSLTVDGYVVAGDRGDGNNSAASTGRCSINTQPWKPGNNPTKYGTGQRIDQSGTIFVATTGGVPGNSTPSFNTAFAATTTDGAVTWTSIGPDFTCSVTDYSAGTITLTFSSAPTGAETVKATYWHAGWGTGTGLMDEDGRNTSWMGVGSDITHLTPDVVQTFAPLQPDQNTAFIADMQALVQPIATPYFQTWYNERNIYAPHSLLFAPYATGSNETPAAHGVYQAASAYVDVMAVASINWTPNPINQDMTQVAPFLSRRNYVDYYSGDTPQMYWVGYMGNPDSSMSLSPNVSEPPDGVLMFNSQASKGQAYASTMDTYFDRVSLWGDYLVVGMNFWNYADQFGGGVAQNWSIADYRDNLQDGVHNVLSPPTDPAVPNFNFGSNMAIGGTNNASQADTGNYGNFTGWVVIGNAIAVNAILGISPTTGTVFSGAVTMTGGGSCCTLEFNFNQ